MIFSNILKTSFSRAVDVCSVSAGFSVEDIAVGCCFFTPLFITFHHKNNQNMVNVHHKHPISVHFFQFAKWKITILRFGTTIKDYKGTIKSTSRFRSPFACHGLPCHVPRSPCGTTGSINSWRKPMMQRWPSVAAATEVRRRNMASHLVLPKWGNV